MNPFNQQFLDKDTCPKNIPLSLINVLSIDPPLLIVLKDEFLLFLKIT